MALSFISSRETDEERIIHSKSDNKEFMIYDEADEVIREIIESLLNRY